jgi:hypothetical protein
MPKMQFKKSYTKWIVGKDGALNASMTSFLTIYP